MTKQELKTMMKVQWAYFVDASTFTTVCPDCHNVEYWGTGDLADGGGQMYCCDCDKHYDICIDDDTRKKLDSQCTLGFAVKSL
jgi:hypothetical protein